MANNYGQQDAGSVIGAAMPYGQAVASIAGPPAAKPGQPAANPWKASWQTVNGLSDYYYEKEPGNWQVIPDHVRNSNKGQFGLPAVQARRAADQKAEQDAKLEKINANQKADQLRQEGRQDRRWAVEDQRHEEDRAERNQTRQDELSYRREQMQATREEGAANREQQDRHFKSTEDRTARAMELNNQLMSRKLDVEDRHFQQKLAYDKRMDRRAQIISSLSLVAQSLSRL